MHPQSQEGEQSKDICGNVHKPSGICPEMFVFDIFKNCKDALVANLSSCFGMTPVMFVSLIDSSISQSIFPNSLGIGPVNKGLECKRNSFVTLSCPNSVGMVPLVFG